MEAFNIFKVLEKDNKELIHSSFLRFLLAEYKSFYTIFLKRTDINFQAPVLEKSYSYETKRRRIDIEAISSDKQSILIIENKFMSFPYEEQLKSYDLIYNHHHGNKQKFKLLFCFDKTLVPFHSDSDWAVYDYSDLLVFIDKNCLTEGTDVKQVFIRQYYEFLSDYFNTYESLKNNIKALFIDPKDPNNSKNKFWLRLFYSALHLKLSKQFEEIGTPVSFALSQGNTKVPLIDIFPKHWNINEKQLLIQFQGNDVKFYSHYNGEQFIKELVAVAKESFDNVGIDFNHVPKKNAATCFIFKTKLTNLLADRETYTLDDMASAIYQFYNDINDKIIKTNVNSRLASVGLDE